MARTNTKQDTNKPSKENVRQNIVRGLRTDVSHIMADHPNKTFRWTNDEKGEVDAMMREGWAPVEGNQSAGSFLARQNTDKPSDNAKTGVSFMTLDVGKIQSKDDGVAILLMIDTELFNDIQNSKMGYLDKVDEALGQGSMASSQGISSEDGSTYAPNLPNGKTGFSQSRG